MHEPMKKEKKHKDLSLEEMAEECLKHGKKIPDCLLIIKEKMPEEEMDEGQ